MAVTAKGTGAIALSLAMLPAVVSGRVLRLHVFHIAALLFVIWTGIVVLILAAGIWLPHKFPTWPQLWYPTGWTRTGFSSLPARVSP
jgi:hypothetical protein